jgi:hypothetical protein
MKKLEISINCGEETCASKPGEFCTYFGTTKFGQMATCCLFPSPQEGGKAWTILEVKDGWSMRCKACLDSTVDKKNITRYTKCPQCGSTCHDRYGCYDCDWVESK